MSTLKIDKSGSLKDFYSAQKLQPELAERALNNLDIKREFLTKHDVQRYLWKIYYSPQEIYDALLQLVNNDEGDSVWLSILEESLFIIGPMDPEREQILLGLLRILPVPKKVKSVQLITQRLYKIIHEIDTGNDVKYNVLLVYMLLADVACKWRDRIKDGESNESEEEENEEDTLKIELHKHVFNIRTINSLWLLVNCSNVPTKLLAISVLHTYFENLESPFPTGIEDMLHLHIRRSLCNHRNSELRFLAHYIAKHSFGEKIEKRTEELQTAIKIRKNQTGIGKIYLQPHDGILLDENGLVVRNNTLQLQTAQVPSAVAAALGQGKWYWEITVSSKRYTKIGYFTAENTIYGQELRISK
jgi:hypothetical protein